MVENAELEQWPEAQVSQPRWRLPLIWLLPLVAVLIGIWLVYDSLSRQGPLVSLRFNNAEGIEARKTRIKYRDVDVGMVEDVRFSDDLDKVVVSVRLDRAFNGRIRESTRFWVVRPRIQGMRISGLETLISGAYIGMDLGKGGAPRTEFNSLEEPRGILSDTPGTFYRLTAPDLGSLSQGAPVYFRRIPVGEVVQYALAEDYSQVEIDIFIRSPHDRQVRRTSRFSNVSGVELDLSAKGLKVGVESLVSMMSGGIAFDSPPEAGAGEPAPPGTSFTLHRSRESGDEVVAGDGPRYLLYFEDTVRGLSPGAPVEFRGIRVGRVIEIRFEGDSGAGDMRIPVLIELETDRLPVGEQGVVTDDKARDPDQVRDEIQSLVTTLVRRGLRARLDPGNLLTGQLFVALDLLPQEPPAEIKLTGPYPELPTVPSTLRDMTRNLGRILTKLEQLPLDEIGVHLRDTLAGTDRLANDPAAGQSLAHLSGTLSQIQALMQTLNAKAGPLLDGVNRAGDDTRELLQASKQTVQQAQAALRTLDRALAAEGPLGNELVKTLEQLNAAARSLRLMADTLERHPESLLRGKSGR